MANQVITHNKDKVNIKKPKQYYVVMHNDDFTTMEFVVEVLKSVFNKDVNTANRIMMDVHMLGKGVVGVYPYDIAVTKVGIALSMAKSEGFPFNITIEEE